MSLFARHKEELRSLDSVPWNVGGSTSPLGAEGAWGVVAVYGAIRLLADEISTLPLAAYRRTSDDVRTPIATPSLLRSPAAVGDLQSWLYQLVTSLAGWGNAFGLIVGRDSLGYATGIEWVDPSLVSVDESRPQLPVYYFNGRRVAAEDVVHLRWVLRPGRVVGMAPLDVLRDTVTVASSAMSYKSDWFTNGGTPPGVFKNVSKTVDQGEAETVKGRLVAAIRKHQPIVHGSDWTYESVSMPADTAEWAQTVRLTSTQVAVCYGIPASRLAGDAGGSLTYNNLESDSLQFVKSLRPWLTIIENAISRLLPGNAYVRFNTAGLVSTSLAERMAAYAVQRQIGLRNVDELRALEDLPPLPNGEGKSYAAPTPPAPAALPAPAKEQPDAGS